MPITQIQEKPKSHWQYANRYIQNGLVKFFWFKGIVDISKPSHISTAIKNPNGSLSQALFFLDFDYKTASEEWKVGGTLDFEAIKTRFFEEFPFLLEWYVAATKSSSLTGFHFVFAFPPYLVGHENFKKTDETYDRLGNCLIRACHKLGFGVDPHAWGCNKLTMNWNNPQYRIEFDPEPLNRAWFGDSGFRLPDGRYERKNVLGVLLRAIREHDLIKYKPKKEKLRHIYLLFTEQIQR